MTVHSLPWPDKSIKFPTPADDKRELYGPDDWTQSNDLADQEPDKLRELINHFYIEGSKYNVFPIDDRQSERYNAQLAGRPDLMQGLTSMTMYPGTDRLNENTVMNVKNRSFSVMAKVTIGDEPANGALIAQGVALGGWSFFFKEGLLSYAHNFVAIDLCEVHADKAIDPGEHEVAMLFKYDGGGVGKGGDVTLSVDGTEIGKGRVDRTVPALFSLDEGTDIGEVALEPVTDYGDRGGTFNGTIDWVKLDISDDVEEDAEMYLNATMRRH